MQIVDFNDVRTTIIENIRKKMLIPILGSGFTQGCNALQGNVPSGSDYKKYMIDSIQTSGDFTAEELQSLHSEPFSSVSNIYHQVVPQEKQRKYLKENFTTVSVDSSKRNFLSIPWPYIYTLNIDDAIERNSSFSHVIHSNRPVQNNIFDEFPCVIKLHGDIAEMLNYEDSISEVFDQNQYIASLHKNQSLLSKLTHDFSYQNLLYIGCSLSDEIDLISVSVSSIPHENARFFCTTTHLTHLDKIKLERHKITHCVIFNSYQEIYDLIYTAAQEAEKIAPSELDNYRVCTFSRLPEKFELNKSYLFYGKSLINKDRSITFPYFFISRSITDQLIKNVNKYRLQFLLGSACSGKTYIAFDFASRIRDRDVFVFESKESLSDNALQSLIDRGNCLIVADSNTLNMQQIEELPREIEKLQRQNVSILIIEEKSNHSLSSLLRLLEMTGVIEQKSIPLLEVSNKFSKSEVDTLNRLLVTATLEVFTESKSLADNIIETSRHLIQKNRFDKIVPRLSNERQIACLIALAIENKIYSMRASDLDLIPEIDEQVRFSKPLIELESTWSFETTPSNNAPVKYVINAEYWLYDQLNEFSKLQGSHELIIRAYRHIISRLVTIYGQPDLMYGNKYAQYKPYILFDNINRIFKSHSSQGLVLARKIYESLNDFLSSDPNYMHQRAKCYIRSARFEKAASDKLKFFEKAYRYASVSYSVFNKRYEDTKNEKLYISLSHVEYTRALILCHQARINKYKIFAENTQAVQILHHALSSDYNSYDYAKKDIDNYNNAVLDLITHLIADPSLVDKSVYPLLESLFKAVRT